MSGFESKRQASKSLAANPWRDAIDSGLVCAHIGTIESFPTAKAALAALINWHVQVALDPAVSSDAQALIDRGRAAVAEIAALTEQVRVLREALEYVLLDEPTGIPRASSACRRVVALALLELTK